MTRREVVSHPPKRARRVRKKRWQRANYPTHWEALSQAVKEAHNYTCEHCHTKRGTMRISKAGKPYASKVVAAHRWPNETHNPHPELLCLCECCHMIYDHRFADLMAEGKHQARMHGIALAQQGYGGDHPQSRGDVLPHEQGAYGAVADRLVISTGLHR